MAERGLTINARPKGTLSAYEPSLRDKLAWLLSDMFGGGDRSRANYINEKVRGAADFIPGVGDAIGFDEAKRDFDEGNYGSAALGATTSAIGSIPGVGDAAAAALKGGGSALGMFIGPMAKNFPHASVAKAEELEKLTDDEFFEALEIPDWRRFYPDPDFGSGNMLPIGREDALARKTGLHRGKDGGWRYEISDFGLKDKGNAYVPTGVLADLRKTEGLSEGGDRHVLGDLLHHPELYDNYPQLRDYQVNELPEMNSEGASAYFDPDTKSFGFQTGLESDDLAWDANNLKEKIIHEVQHSIQNLEGWVSGASMARAGSKDRYFRNAGEVEARNSQLRHNYGKLDRRNTPPIKTMDVPFEDQLLDRFDGPVSILMGPTSRLWNKANADKAVDMLQDGVAPGRVWGETGTDWSPKTGDLVQEIPDFRSRVHPNKRTWERNGVSPLLNSTGFSNDFMNPDMLEDVLTHEQFYDAYPDARGIGVVEQYALGYPKSPGGVFMRDAPSQMGIDPGYAASELPNDYMGVTSPATSLDAAGIMDPRSVMLHELQHWVQKTEGWDPGFNPNAAAYTFNRPDSFASRLAANAQSEFINKSPFAMDFETSSNLAKAAAMETYMRNVGETQARNVQARRDLTPDSTKFLRPGHRNPISGVGSMDRAWDEQLTVDDIMNGVYGPNDVPGLSLRGPARRTRK